MLQSKQSSLFSKCILCCIVSESELILSVVAEQQHRFIVMFCDVVEICGAQVPLRGGGKTGRILRAVRLVSGLP